MCKLIKKVVQDGVGAAMVFSLEPGALRRRQMAQLEDHQSYSTFVFETKQTEMIATLMEEKLGFHEYKRVELPEEDSRLDIYEHTVV